MDANTFLVKLQNFKITKRVNLHGKFLTLIQNMYIYKESLELKPKDMLILNGIISIENDNRIALKLKMTQGKRHHKSNQI